MTMAIKYMTCLSSFLKAQPVDDWIEKAMHQSWSMSVHERPTRSASPKLTAYKPQADHGYYQSEDEEYKPSVLSFWSKWTFRPETYNASTIK